MKEHRAILIFLSWLYGHSSVTYIYLQKWGLIIFMWQAGSAFIRTVSSVVLNPGKKVRIILHNRIISKVKFAVHVRTTCNFVYVIILKIIKTRKIAWFRDRYTCTAWQMHAINEIDLRRKYIFHLIRELYRAHKSNWIRAILRVSSPLYFVTRHCGVNKKLCCRRFFPLALRKCID